VAVLRDLARALLSLRLAPGHHASTEGVVSSRTVRPHETASVHFRALPEVTSFRSGIGPDPHLRVKGDAHATANHYRSGGASEVRVNVDGEAAIYLSPEQAEAVVAQLSAHLTQMGRMRQAETAG
jgi:hypothetical protein